jgi:hypothetical protein
MVSDQQVIGQKDKTAQEGVVDDEDEKDVPDIFFDMDELSQGDLGSGEGHNQDKGRQKVIFQEWSIIP